MNQGIFFEHFELLADAPNGVQKLRALILQLAVQGKLVPQDPNDEPAGVLLEKIGTKKEKIMKEKKLKKINTLPVTKSEYNAIGLPEGWELVKLGEIVQKLGAGSTPKGGKAIYQEAGIKFIRSQNVWNSGPSLQNVAYIPLKIHERMNGTVVEPGDILLNITGASIGRSALVPDDFDEGNVSQHVAIIRLIDNTLRYYVHLYLISPFIQNTIMDVQVGISREGLSMSRLKDFLIPIPPLSEADRIVAKVDQLMALCDQLEARQQEKHDNRIRLNNAALDKLFTAPTPGEFAQHWQRICDNFVLLYDAPETVGQLRQAVLQLAVQGKLVAQDPNNKPASQLINDIIEERKKWYENECEMAIYIGSRKPKKPKLTSIEFPEELDLPRIPESWQFCLFEDIAASKENAIKAGPFGSALTKNCYVPSGYKIYGQEQVIKGDASFGDYYIDDTKFSELESCEVAPGDILISLVGTIGKVLILPNDCESGIINPRLVKLSLNAKINQRFIEIYLNSPLTKDFLSNVAHGGTMNILNLKILKNLPVPIPPTEEQAQIVAKVDQLMALCDELEAGLVQAQTDGGRLMEAVVHHVLAA